ncbi:hypothetical protein BDV97DRAFT_367033 [Delphinella strobiligena]|nr:hypothetical protein BDV97DRAFT_367033 [Delphinella strobiligena]
MSKKCYFLAPTRDTPPDGRIALGNIIASISDPEDSINDLDPLACPPSSVHRSCLTNWKSERTKSQAKKGGVWSGFLQAVGVGGELSLTRTSSRTDAYEFKKLTTTYFVPTKQYIEKSISDPAVKNWMLFNRGAPLYMITGVKVASGATFMTELAKERGFRFQLGIDATPLGVPLTAGPNFDIWNSSKESESSETESDFVFAFRVREILYKQKGGIDSKDYVKGAMYGLEGKPVGEAGVQRHPAFEVDGLADEDPAQDEFRFGFRTVEAYDDDDDDDDDDDASSVICVVPEGFYTG